MEDSQEKHKVEVHKIDTKTKNSLEELRVDLVRFPSLGNFGYACTVPHGKF